MDITVLNTNFEAVYILDAYESLIWVDKFSEPGTFEIYTKVTDDILTYLKKDYYLINPASEHIMIVEDISIESNVETGDKIKIIGRSLESILDRRIIWTEICFKEGHDLQLAIQKLISKNIGEDAEAERKISNFRFQSTTDATITSLKLTDGAQYNGNNLLDVIKGLCEENKIGFKVVFNDAHQFVFSIYNGVNRSYSQTEKPYVVYSPEFDNMLSSNYKEENSKTKNVALVVGGDGDTTAEDPKEPTKRTIGTATGIERRELYVNATDISKTVEQENDSGTKTEMKQADFEKLLDQRGKKELAVLNNSIKSFDGQCDTTKMYVYGTDFFMGDIVQLANEYGMQATSRVTEFTWSCTTSGLDTYPTFVSVEEEVEE